MKKKILTANHKPYMTKNLRKAMMKRSEFETKFIHTKNPVIQVVYKKQTKNVSRLYEKESRKYYNNVVSVIILITKGFGEQGNLFLMIKSHLIKVNNLLINGKIVNKDDEIAQNLNNYFANAVKSLDIQENNYLLTDNKNIDDPIHAAIKKFELHPSILKIKVIVKCDIFAFNEVTFQEIEQELRNLDTQKSTTFNNISPKHLKENYDICGSNIMQLVNETINDCDFPNGLELTNITPIHKCGEKIYQKNYISFLPVLSKIYERVMQQQINSYIENCLSPFMCGYRKGYNP